MSSKAQSTIVTEPGNEEGDALAPDKCKVDLVSWLLTIATWDGLLPASMILVLTVLNFLLPRQCPPIVGGILGGAYGLAVCIGVLVRMPVGSRHVALNQCSATFRCVQFAFLSLGILLLAILDCLLMLIESGAMLNREDYIISGITAAVLYSTYLTSMAIAMYPGRTIRGY
jgi:hypothetical protein